MLKNRQQMGQGVTAPEGFMASGVVAQIKGIESSNRDLALIVADRPCAAAGVFTTNQVKAAPIKVTQQRVANGRLRAIVINSGNANACTGDIGHADAEAMTEITAKRLQIGSDDVAVASTGVIGVKLPMERIERGILSAADNLSPHGNSAAAQAIMTTDTAPKETSLRVVLPSGGSITVGGMAKGAGMIHPNMATMLCFITTDTAIQPQALRAALREKTDSTFNMISVDGDTSTNDMVIALANGAAANPVIDENCGEDYLAFASALGEVMVTLAKALVRDGEGASKVMEVCINGASCVEDARLMARAVVGSSLVKTAIYGKDANWGRILCAMGYSGAPMNPQEVDLYLGEVQVMCAGAGLDFDETAAQRVLERDEVHIRAELHQGSGTAKAWGCDLSHAYVDINADYRT